MTYEKDDLHAIVWTSLWQVGLPLIVFDILEDKQIAAAEENGETDYELDRETKAWEEISFWSMITWGPTFVIGLLNLSEIVMPVGAFWIEHVLSNLMIPAYLRNTYLLLEVAILEEDQEHWWKLLGWLFMTWIIYSAQVSIGTEAINFLKYNDEYYDDLLRPSLFYILKWIEHTPREEEHDYDNYYL